jgi:hypothetical protein
LPLQGIGEPAAKAHANIFPASQFGKFPGIADFPTPGSQAPALGNKHRRIPSVVDYSIR